MAVVAAWVVVSLHVLIINFPLLYISVGFGCFWSGVLTIFPLV